MKKVLNLVLVSLLVSLCAVPARAAVVSITAAKDAVIYQDGGGGKANGAGSFLHAGMNGPSGGNLILRSLVEFNVAGGIPAGAVITSATLRLVVTKAGGATSLYRVTDSWSEGPTAAPSGEAGGATSATGDVTWIHRTYDTQTWANAGGDFDPTARATGSGASSPMEFSSAALVADVQAMLDSPGGNFGWMIRADNEAAKSIQMLSRNNVGSEPTLVVGYSTSPQPTLYYDFEEGGPSVITNKAPAAGGTNGILTGAAAAWVAGPPGSFTPSQALQFDGIHPSSGGVWIDTAYNATGLSAGDYDYTVCAWINFTKNTGDCMLVGQSMNPNFLHLGVRNRNVHFGHYGSDLTSTTLLNTGVWYHVAWVFAGGRTAGVQRIFINGVCDRVQGDKVMIRDVVTNIIVGSTDSVGTSGRAFRGAADELAVYPVALSESQIAFLAAGGSPLNVPDAALSDRDFFTAPYGANGTWNLYERVGARNGSVTSWYGAFQVATASVAMIAGVTSTPHLVTISTNTENEFIRRLLRWDATNYVQTTIENCWIGLSDDTSGLIPNSCAEGGDTNTVPAVATRRAAFSNWVDGTVVSYSNWAGVEPNDAAPGEDGIEINSAGQWNDQRSGVPGTGQDTNSVDNIYIIEWDVNSPTPIISPSATVRQVQAVLPATLPGPGGSYDSFGGLWIRSPAGLGEIRGGLEQLLRSAAPGYGATVIQTNEGITYINAYDPDRPGDINVGLIPSNLPFFGQAAGVTDANWVVVYKGMIRIRSADAGIWTFGVHSDDGFALRLPGHDWQNVHGLGWRDHADTTIMGYEYGTGDSNTRGTVNLAVGDHPIEFVVYNATGGEAHELYAAKGDFTNDSDTANWLPVGFFTTNALATPGILDPGDGLGWTAWHSTPATFGGIGNTNQAWLAVEPSISGDSNKTFWSSINFYDAGSGATPASGSIGNSVRFPYDIESVLNTETNVAMFMSSKLVIPADGTYYLGFQGDDGSWLRVAGQTWNSIVYQYIVSPNVYIEGDKLVCNVGGGNTRTIGSITLAAGTYDLEALWWQGVGGAHFEILGGDPDSPMVNAPTALPLLFTGAAAVNPISGGLQLVSTSPPPDVVITPFTRAGNAGNVTWNARRGSTYAVESSTNFVDWTELIGGATTNLTTDITQTVPLTNAFPVEILRIRRTAP